MHLESCADPCKHMDTMLPGLVGVSERVSTNNSKQDENQSRSDCISKLSIQSSPRVSNICSARPPFLNKRISQPLVGQVDSLDHRRSSQSSMSPAVSLRI